MSAARGVQRERPVYDPVGVNRPLHILYVVQYFNLPSEPGGGRAYHFATHWARAGHRVTVVTGMVNTKTASIAEKYRGRAFVEEIGAWWRPSELFQTTPRPGRLSFEPGEGGRLIETREGGKVFEIGRIRAWEPPRRLVFSWHQANFPPDLQTEVEVSFEAVGDETRVGVEHRGFDRVPAGAARPTLFNHYADSNGGASGAPIVSDDDFANTIFAVHVAGFQDINAASWNMGVLLTPAAVANIKSWMRQAL